MTQPIKDCYLIYTKTLKTQKQENKQLNLKWAKELSRHLTEKKKKRKWEINRWKDIYQMSWF